MAHPDLLAAYREIDALTAGLGAWHRFHLEEMKRVEGERDAAQASLVEAGKDRDAYEVHRDLVIAERDVARAALREAIAVFGDPRNVPAHWRLALGEFGSPPPDSVTSR